MPLRYHDLDYFMDRKYVMSNLFIWTLMKPYSINCEAPSKEGGWLGVSKAPKRE